MIREAAERAAGDHHAARQKAEETMRAVSLEAEQAAIRIQTARHEAEAGLDGLGREAAGVVERSTQQLRSQADAGAEQFKEQIKAAVSALAQQTRSELGAIARETAESVSREIKAAGVASRDELRGLLEEFVSRSAQEVAALGAQAHDSKYDNAKRQKAAFEGPLREFTRLERGLMRRAAGLTGDLAALGTVLFTSLSFRPVMRLRAEPPKQFYDEYLELDAKRRSGEEKLARAYWECARLNIQGRYSFGKDLPETPPPEFRIDDKLPAGLTVDPASRVRYWARLRLVWLLPQSWDKSYGWHTHWTPGVRLTQLIGKFASR